MTRPQLDTLRVLVADDEPDLREILSETLSACGATVWQAKDGAEAARLLRENPVHLVLSDVRMPGGSGLQFLDHVQSLPKPRPAFVLISGFTDLSREEAQRRGAADLLLKPFRLAEILAIAQQWVPSAPT